jgi:hypothetical protein
MPTRNTSTDEITTFSANFEGVGGKGFGAAAHVTPGDYLLQLINATVRIKKGDEQKPTKTQSRHVRWVFRIVAGGQKPTDIGVIYHTSPIQVPGKEPKDYLWNLRGILTDLLAAQGKTIEDRGYNIDLAKYIGLRLGAVLGEDSPYTRDDGTVVEKSKIVTTYPATEYAGPIATQSPEAVANAADDADDADATVGDDEDADDDDLSVADL